MQSHINKNNNHNITILNFIWGSEQQFTEEELIQGDGR